jgi:hypothetical protein
MNGERRNARKISVEKPAVERPHGRPRRGLKDNITMDLREIWGEVVDWINLGQDRE